MGRCLSRALTFGILLATAAAAHGQTVDEIVARNIEAKGGEKWKSVTSVRMTGKVSMQGMELPLTVYAKRPNYNRQEITLQGRQLVQAFDGTSGWAINPMTGSDEPRELPRELSELMRNSADFEGALINYKEKGHSIELVGKEKLGAADVYHLKMTMKSGHVQHYYLDAKTGVELKTATEVDVMGAGQKQTIETEMSNYRQVDGIMIPHTVRQVMNGKPLAEMTIEKVELNAPADDALFRMPKK